MSAVIHYKCNNPECDFKTRREAHFPIWKSDSPKEWRNLPVGIRNEKFVAGYVNRQYCISCKTIQPYLKSSDMCLICEQEGLFIKDGSKCPKCNNGVMNEIEGKTIQF